MSFNSSLNLYLSYYSIKLYQVLNLKITYCYPLSICLQSDTSTKPLPSGTSSLTWSPPGPSTPSLPPTTLNLVEAVHRHLRLKDPTLPLRPHSTRHPHPHPSTLARSKPIQDSPLTLPTVIPSDGAFHLADRTTGALITVEDQAAIAVAEEADVEAAAAASGAGPWAVSST